MTEPLPQEKPFQEDPLQALGEKIDNFPILDLKLKRWMALFVAVLAIIAAIVLTLTLIDTTWTAIQTHGRAVILRIFPLPMALYVLLFILGILLLVYSVVHWKDGITLFESGIIRKTGKQAHTWLYRSTQRFDSYITQINFGGSIVSTRVKMIFEDDADSRWIIRNRYDRMADLIQMIRSSLLPGLILVARQRLAEGEALKFHADLNAKGNGLLISDQEFHFEDLEIKIKNRTVRLHPKDNLKQTLQKSPIKRIRNLDVLIDLIENPPVQTHHSSPK